MIEKRPVEYSHGGALLEGLLVCDPEGGPRPTVIVAHTFVGRGPNEEAAAERLAALGYTAFAADLYGKGVLGTTREECAGLMQPFMEDRAHLQDRMLALLDTVRALPHVDAGRIVAIGYCFGGLCVLDLARTGAELAGVASMHGLFEPPGNRDGTRISAKVVAYHGWDDPMVPPASVTALGHELTAAGADWQIHAYGGVMHGFTNPNAAAPENGVLYDPRAAGRAWASLLLFLEECFASS
jgi:dienelactone hydrolase